MFVENLERLADERRMSLSGVAKALGMSNNAATKWRNGSVPNGQNLQKIADYFGVSIEDLLKDNPTGNYISGVTNSAVIQGNTGNNVHAVVGGSVSDEQSSDPNEAELIRIYRALSMRDRLKLMQQAYDLEDGVNP